MTFLRDFVPVAGRPRWYKHKMSMDDWLELEARTLALHERYPLPLQIVCGLLGDDFRHSIYAIENASAIDLAREFETGSHNAWARPRTSQVCDELARVYRIAPFRPYFVDSAGYKAKFSDRLTKEQALAIEGILTVGLEGYISEYSGTGPVLAHTLVDENALRLWWD